MSPFAPLDNDALAECYEEIRADAPGLLRPWSELTSDERHLARVLIRCSFCGRGLSRLCSVCDNDE